MIIDTVSCMLHADAPSAVYELRKSFDDRLTDLHNAALQQVAENEHGASPIVHVDYPHGALQVTAISNAGSDRFTQLVARAADEAHHERPSFTITSSCNGGI